MQRPSVFYKYASAGTSLLVLRNGRLRWSSPLLFNDVAEFQRMPRFEPTVTEAYRLLPEIISDAVFGRVALDEVNLGPSMKVLLRLVKNLVVSGVTRQELLASLAGEAPSSDDRIRAELQRFFAALDLSTARVLCVTTEHDNDLMWGNYAESHTGCVLGFRHIEELSTPLLAAEPIAYSEDRPVVGSGLDFLLYGDTSALRDRTLRAVCYTKKLSWSHEREWRALTWRSNEHGSQYGDYLFYPEELESITVGVRASASTEEQVLQVLAEKYPEATAYRMEAVNGDLKRRTLASSNESA